MAAYQAVRAKNVGLDDAHLPAAAGGARSSARACSARASPASFRRASTSTRISIPTYNPWDQRLCVCPDGDLFAALSDGSASIVTDTIKTFTEHGIELAGGDELEADVIVTATGLNLIALGGIELSLDGAALDLPSHMVYKGMMMSGVPNHAMSIGYTNASWTLKCDLTCEYVCRLLKYMDRTVIARRWPIQDDGSIADRQPLIDLNSGYVLRSAERPPQPGLEAPVAAVSELRARRGDAAVARAR